MENVMVISPPPIMNGTNMESNVSDDDTESIILDLHVSDDSKDMLQEISEEDILNKYIADEDEELVGKKMLDQTLVNIDLNEKSRDINNKSAGNDLNNENEEILKTEKTGDDDDDDNTESIKSLDLENNEKIDGDETINCQLNENEENKTENINDDNSKNNTETHSTEIKKNDDENQEDGDLLQVMETAFVDEQEKDDTSSSSEKDDNGKDEDPLRRDDEDTNDEINMNEENSRSNEEINNEESNNEEMNNEDTNIEEISTNNEIKEKKDEATKTDEIIEENASQESKEMDLEKPIIEEVNQINGELDQNQEDQQIENQIDKDADVDQNDDCAMDIEENNVGGIIILDNSDEMRKKARKGDKDGDSKVAESDSNKESPMAIDDLAPKNDESKDKQSESDNVEAISKVDEKMEDDENNKNEDVRNNVKSDNTALKKITKRQLPNDFETENEDPAKKMKLDQNVTKKKSENVQTKALNSFKLYMKEETLHNMTRAQLEEFCLQKVCECLVDKSELADLRQKIRTLEQTIEQFRRESVTIANQTRDLKIVHEKVSTALKIAKEQKSKPLVPVKITRSVGLQAVLDQNIRQNRINGILQSGKNTNSNNNNSSLNNVNNVQNVNKNNNNVTTTVTNNNLNNIRSPGKTQPSVIQSTRLATRTPAPTANVKQTILNKQLAQKENRQTSPIQAQVNGKKPSETTKAVIDLTDEDEKTSNSPNKAVRTNGQATKNTSVVTTPTGTKVMVIPSTVLTRPVMLKVNPNVISKTTNITIPTTQVSVVTQSPTTPAVTTQSVVTKLTSIRPITSTQPTNTQTTRSPVQRFRQSTSPLPPPPPDQHHPGRMVPPKPHLNLTKSPCGTGIVLQWKMPYQLSMFDAIVSYQLYAYQVPKANQKTDGWGKIGDVKALELPMAVTLTQFAVGYRYYFAVRAVDSHQRVGLFSEPQTITL